MINACCTYVLTLILSVCIHVLHKSGSIAVDICYCSHYNPACVLPSICNKDITCYKIYLVHGLMLIDRFKFNYMYVGHFHVTIYAVRIIQFKAVTEILGSVIQLTHSFPH